MIERRGIDEGLERRARLTLRLHGAVEFAGGIAEAAGQRQDVTGERIERHDGAVDGGNFAQGGIRSGLWPLPAWSRARHKRDVARLHRMVGRDSAPWPRWFRDLNRTGSTAFRPSPILMISASFLAFRTVTSATIASYRTPDLSPCTLANAVFQSRFMSIFARGPR